MWGRQQSSGDTVAYYKRHQTVAHSRITTSEPMKNLWHELKEYIWQKAKGRSKQELILDIKVYQTTVTVKKCPNAFGT